MSDLPTQARTVAVTGKGGVGKTTFAAMAVRWLCEQGRTPVLAIDADPNICLDAALGVCAENTVGGVREEARQIAKAGMGAGISKHEFLDIKIQQALVEAEGFDLIAMGRPEGPGCYCYANDVLKRVLDRLVEHYPHVVVDSEAGLENLSRRTVRQVDTLVFVTDPSARGLATAQRLYELSCEMQVAAGRRVVVINRARDAATLERAHRLFEGKPVQVLGSLPEDAGVVEHDAAGGSVFELTEDNAAYAAASTLCSEIFEHDNLETIKTGTNNGEKEG